MRRERGRKKVGARNIKKELECYSQKQVNTNLSQRCASLFALLLRCEQVLGAEAASVNVLDAGPDLIIVRPLFHET